MKKSAEEFYRKRRLFRLADFVKVSLRLFKAVPNFEDEKFPSYTLNNERNLANGFFITEKAFRSCPFVAGRKFFDFLKRQFGYNIYELNQGFYKSFETVATSTPQKLLANKLLHYFSTYGMESLGIFDRDLVYIPNDVLELPADAKPIKITIIDALDKAEIEFRANKLIQAGVALSEETVADLMTAADFLDIELKVDDVPNKEFAVRLCEQLNILPKNPVQFLRYMIYRGTGSTLLIKDNETISALKNSEVDFDGWFSSYIKKNGLGKLASVFHRFKPLWLAFKPHSDYLRSTINKMRKLAVRYHEPVKPRLLDHLTSAEKIDLDELKNELAKVTTFKKLSIANAILYRQAKPDTYLYSIRNGKAFVMGYHHHRPRIFAGLKFDAQEVLDVIMNSVAEDIKPNVQGKRIYIPESFNYAVPTSEKKFFGNIPYGSSYNFESKSVIVGVHWFNLVEDDEELRVDLDMHLNSDSFDIGWDNDFANENFINAEKHKIIFSGDMTDAPVKGGGATEAFFVGEAVTDEDIMANVNNYTYREENPKPVPFKLILADVKQEKIDRKYLVDSHEIAFCLPGEINSGEKFLGFLSSDKLGAKKFYFFSRNMGNRIVARSTWLTIDIISAVNTAFKSNLSLNEILRRAGAILENVTAEDCDINLDPLEVTKDTLLGLLMQ